MRFVVALLAGLSTFGCSAAQLNQVDSILTQAPYQSAARLATSAAIAELAIVHMAAALSIAASKELGASDTAPLTNSADPGAEFSYEIDEASQNATIYRTREGQRTVDFSFRYQGERSNFGIGYSVVQSGGAFEGFQLVFPRLTFLFSTITGEDFKPVRHESGYFLLNVHAEGNGSLGIRNVETMRITRAVFDMVYPLAAADAEVGELIAQSDDGSTFSGRVNLKDKAIRLEGLIQDREAANKFKLATEANGEMRIEPASQAGSL